MKNKVRLVEFKISDFKKEEVEEALADLLDEGFTIVSQHEAEGHLNYTLVRQQADQRDAGDYHVAQQKYKLEGGVVVPVNSGSVLH